MNAPSLHPNNSRTDAAATRIYSVKTSSRVIYGLLGVVIVTAATFGMWDFGTGSDIQDATLRIFLVVLCLGFFALGTYVALWVFRASLNVGHDGVEYRGVLMTRALRDDCILGYRTIPQQYGAPLLMLVPREGHGRKLKFSMMFKVDAAFYDWLARFNDLDRLDTCASQDEILSSQDLGSTPEQRLAKLGNAKLLQRFATISTFALAAWGWFYPTPYPVVICILAGLPILAILIALRSNGLYRLDQERNDAHPNLAIPFVLPGAVLGMRAILDFEIVGWHRPTIIALLIAITMTALVAVADPITRTKPWTLAALLFCTCMYGYGASLEANSLLDRSASQTFSPSVVSRFTTHGKRTEHYVTVEPWGPYTDREKIEVSQDVYDSAEVGHSVCIELRAGALWVPWYTVDTCK
jgi:hypothetical protein